MYIQLNPRISRRTALARRVRRMPPTPLPLSISMGGSPPSVLAARKPGIKSWIRAGIRTAAARIVQEGIGHSKTHPYKSPDRTRAIRPELTRHLLKRAFAFPQLLPDEKWRGKDQIYRAFTESLRGV